MFLAALTLLRNWLSPICGLSPGLTFIFARALAASATGSYLALSAAGSSETPASESTAATHKTQRMEMRMGTDPQLRCRISYFRKLDVMSQIRNPKSQIRNQL